jgi:hypothetical protein
MNVDLNEYYNYDEFDKIIAFLRKSKLENLNLGNNILSKTLTKLQQVEKPDKIFELVHIFANYPINVFPNELKESLRILISMK